MSSWNAIKIVMHKMHKQKRYEIKPEPHQNLCHTTLAKCQKLWINITFECKVVDWSKIFWGGPSMSSWNAIKIVMHKRYKQKRYEIKPEPQQNVCHTTLAKCQKFWINITFECKVVDCSHFFGGLYI